jgi:uncharacterized repeat protein (TIGR01451 family)
MNSRLGRRPVAVILLVAFTGAFLAVGVPRFDTADASVPGGNGKIAFESARDGNLEIYVMDESGAGQLNITNNSSADVDAAWSPDGTRIAFARATAHFDIWVMDADGSGATNLTPMANDGNGNTGIEPAWSPDGTRIAYTDGHEIWSMAPDGSDKTNLTATAPAVGIEKGAAYSPDGSQIAMIRNGDVWVMNEDGSNPVQLTTTPSDNELGPDWSPDGTRIVFQRGSEIWTMNPDGSEATAIVAGAGKSGVNPAWSPDGRRIIFASTAFGALNGLDIFTMNPDGSDVRRLDTAANTNDDNPHWQPVVAATDLGVTIAESRDPARVDRVLTYTIEVTNHGPVSARLVSLYSVLPFGTKFDSVTSSQGSCTKKRSSLTCKLGNMEAEGVATINLTVIPIAPFDLSYRVDITSSSGDLNPENDFAVAQTGILLPLGGEPDARITWRVPNRLRDADGDGLLDEEAFNNPKASVPEYEMTIVGCTSSPAGHVVNYDFEITLPNGDVLEQSSPDCRFSFNPPREGIYPVKLTITDEDGGTSTDRRDVPFKDFFIVSLGDSVASGEGNPEIICNQGCHWWDPPETWQDRRCHRTSKSGPSRAALAIEESDPTTSVTFTHLACSGAQITSGILYHYRGIEPPDDTSLIRPQVSVLKDLMEQWGRKPDAVLISIGANDAQFADAVTRCLLPDRCHKDEDFVAEVRRRMNRLPGRFELLGNKLDDLGIPGNRVFITEYFDPTRNHSNRYVQCVDFIFPSEWQWAKENVIDKLNEHVGAAAARPRHGWNAVTGIARSYATHGYCSFSSWVVRLEQSIDWQGDANGAFHPNGLGHILYGSSIANALKAKLY